MKIIRAVPENFPEVKQITQATIRAVYPRYYPAGAVEFFCRHHSDERISSDIAAGKVYLIGEGACFSGTVTISGNGISRLFVLPQEQHKGYGRALLDFAEQAVLARYGAVVVDASLPAKPIYRKRGYRETECHIIPAENGDFLCYDVMELRRE